MNYFWDLLEGVPGIRAHRVKDDDGQNTMGGWYTAHGLYKPEERGWRFCTYADSCSYKHTISENTERNYLQMIESGLKYGRY